MKEFQKYENNDGNERSNNKESGRTDITTLRSGKKIKSKDTTALESSK